MAYAAGQNTNIANNLVFSILTTLFCCLPFGIVAIVYAAQVNGNVASGNIPAAQAASEKAKKWCWISFGCGLVGVILYFILMVAGALAGA